MIQTIETFKFVTTPAELRRIADEMQWAWDVTEIDDLLPIIRRDVGDVMLVFDCDTDQMQDTPAVASSPVASRSYICPVFLRNDDDGTYSVASATLPGVCSRGFSVDEALSNISEALVSDIESYLATGDPIPWRRIEEAYLPSGWYTDCILVTV